MKELTGVFKGDILTAELHDSVTGGVNMAIYLQRQGKERSLIHFANYSDYDAAEEELKRILPTVKWRDW